MSLPPSFSTLFVCAIFLTPLSAQVGGHFEKIYGWAGQAEGDNFGWTISDAGDVNGDGFDDVIIGSPHASRGFGIPPGRVYVYSGATGDLLWSWVITDQYNTLFGYSVSSAGDVNGDGYPDIVVGAPDASGSGLSHAGAVVVYSGLTGAQLLRIDGATVDSRLGRSVSGAGDVNQDGFDDIIAGASGVSSGGYYNNGAVFVYSGKDGTCLYEWNGQGDHELLGNQVSDLGDINLDGHADVLVGSYRASPGGQRYAGSVYVYSGLDGSTLFQWDGDQMSDYFGSSVANAGDIDGDGFADIAISSVYDFSARGVAVIYSGRTGQELFHEIGSDVPFYNFGRAIEGAGDVNGDGFDDFLIGISPGQFPSPYFGAARLYSGASHEILQSWESDEPIDQLGASFGGGGDIDGDGLSDILLPAARADFAGLEDVGIVRAVGFRPGIQSNVSTFSASAGELVSIQVDLPTEASGYIYKVIFSASGPGQMFSGIPIPLFEDSMVHRNYFGIYPFEQSFNLHGILNQNGDAIATILIAPNEFEAHLTGRTFYMAAVASSTGLKPAEFSSVALQLDILP